MHRLLLLAWVIGLPITRLAGAGEAGAQDPDPIVQLPRYEVRARAISDFGMSVVTNFGVLWGGKIKWMSVGQVLPGSSAAQAGLQTGDYILTLDDRPFRDLNRKEMLGIFFHRPVGTRLKLLVRTVHKRQVRLVELQAGRERFTP